MENTNPTESVKTIVVGNAEYAATDVKEFEDTILAVRIDGEYAKEYTAMTEEEQNCNPKFKIGLKLTKHTYHGYSKRKNATIDDDSTIWVSSFDIIPAMMSNDVIRTIYMVDVLAGMFDCLIGCRVKGYNILQHQGKIPKYPYGNPGTTPLEHDITTNAIDVIMCDSNNPEQRNKIVPYFKQYGKQSTKFLCKSLIATHSLNEFDDDFIEFINAERGITTASNAPINNNQMMMQMMQMMMQMMNK